MSVEVVRPVPKNLPPPVEIIIRSTKDESRRIRIFVMGTNDYETVIFNYQRPGDNGATVGGDMGLTIKETREFAQALLEMIGEK